MLLSVVTLFFSSFIIRGDLLVLASFDASPKPPDIIDTGYAKYLGNRTFPNVVAYLGVPYAEPPLGDRRFRAPLPLDKARVSRDANGHVVNATQYPAFCIQGTTGAGDAGGAGSEDCLNVNIYTPVGAKHGSNLPVLVYIHGGGYIFGNPANWPFDHWVKQSPNVVVVSVYYRLSAFGFLAAPGLRNSENGDLNAGFLDQIQALRWVKENIASFGGNPNKVTVSGHSAGASSTELHLVANGNEGLFSAAIAQSVFRTPLPTPEQQIPLFAFFAQQAGCGSGSFVAQITCLRRASISALARAQDAAVTPSFTASGYNVFHPVVDGKVITDFPTRSILAGKFSNVPLVVGSTTDDALVPGNNATTIMRSFFPSITDLDINALVAAYPLADFASPFLELLTLTGDSELRCARSIMGTEFGKVAKSFTYRYNQKIPGASAVFHAAENFIMFKGTTTGFNGTTTFNALTPNEDAFAQELISYWLSFVRSEDPNTFKLSRSPTWSPFTSQHSRMVLQAEPDNSTTSSGSFLETQGSEETARCNLVASQVLHQQN